jgi:hypothetical protein
MLLQSVDLVCQSNNLGELNGSQLFMPSPLKLGEEAYEWGMMGSWFSQ